jgi:hypothetical protein
MNYVQIPTKGEDADRLLAALPQLRGHYYDQREWTIRRRTPNATPPPSEPTVFVPPDAFSADPYFENDPEDEDPWDSFPGASFLGSDGNSSFSVFSELPLHPGRPLPKLVVSSVNCECECPGEVRARAYFAALGKKKEEFKKGVEISVRRIVGSAFDWLRMAWWATRLEEMTGMIKDFARSKTRRLDGEISEVEP